MSHDTNINESWHTYQWVMAYIWMRHDTRRDYVRRKNLAALSSTGQIFHIWMSHVNESCANIKCCVTHINQSWHTFEWDATPDACCLCWLGMYSIYVWLMSRISMGHATYINESCHSKNLPKQQNLSSHEIRTEKISWSLSWKRGPYRLRFPAEAAFQTQNITWKSDRT